MNIIIIRNIKMQSHASSPLLFSLKTVCCIEQQCH